MAYATEIYHWNKASFFPRWKKMWDKYYIFRNASVQTRQFLTPSSAQAAPALPVLLQSCCGVRAAVHPYGYLMPEPRASAHTSAWRGFHRLERAGRINPCSQPTTCKALISVHVTSFITISTKISTGRSQKKPHISFGTEVPLYCWRVSQGWSK